jgi:ABC-2 type transport system permease protein
MPILRKVLGGLRFIAAYTSANVQAAMEYRSAFIVQVVTMLANDCLWLFFWWSYFSQFPLNGWHTTDIVVLWAIAGCGFGLNVAIFGNAPYLVSLIMNGGLDAYLGMPRYALLHVLVARSSPSAWGDILFGIGAYLLLVRPNLLHILLFVLLVIMVALIITSFTVLLSSSAFFLGNTEEIVSQVLNLLLSFSTYPIDIFQGAVRLLLFTVIPAGFTAFVPIQLLRQFTWPLFGAMVGVTVLLVLLAAGLFELGLRRYESGNLLGMQQ